MIQSFHDKGTRDLFNGRDSKAARKTCPKELWTIARRKLDHLDFAGALHDLGRPPGNRLHALRGDRVGQHAIAINNQYRICFTWTPEGPAGVEVTDYH